MSKNTANIQINEKVNKKIKNTKKPIIHLAKNPKDKWLLILCRANGGIENIPKIFLANLDSNSLFTTTDSSIGDLSVKNETLDVPINRYMRDPSIKSIRSQLNSLSLDSNNNNNISTFKQSISNINQNQRIVNALLEIRLDIQKDVENLNNKMEKIDEKILSLIHNFPIKPDSRDVLSPLSEKSNIEFIDSFSANSPIRQLSSLRSPSPRLEETNSNLPIITTFNEVAKIPKSPTSILETNKLNPTKLNKSKSFGTESSKQE